MPYRHDNVPPHTTYKKRWPTSLEKGQFLKFFIVNACETTWTVFAETAFDAVGETVLTLLTTGPADIARSLFRPKGLSGRPHGRRGVGDPYREGAIPNTEDIIADHIPGKDIITDRHVVDGPRMLWEFDAATQEAGYYWLIADVVEDFWYNWHSGIIKNPASDCPNISRMVRHGDGYFAGPFDGFISCPLPTLIASNNTSDDADGCHMLPGTYCLTFSMTMENNGGFGQPAEYQIRFLTGSGYEQAYYSRRVVLYPGFSADLIVSTVIKNPTNMAWEMGKFPHLGGGSEGFYHKATAFVMQMA